MIQVSVRSALQRINANQRWSGNRAKEAIPSLRLFSYIIADSRGRRALILYKEGACVSRQTMQWFSISGTKGSIALSGVTVAKWEKIYAKYLLPIGYT
jgi:hypothetical protein